MRNLIKTLELKSIKFIFFDENPDANFEGEPEDKKQEALRYLSYAKEKSILMSERENDFIEALVQGADMTENFHPDKLIPHRVVVDFLFQNPPLIILNQVIHQARTVKAISPDDRFVDIFKIAVAGYLGLIS